MTGTELQERLDAAERSARWLAEKLDRSHTQIGRWLSGEQPIPQERSLEIRALLAPVPGLTSLEPKSIVKPLPGLKTPETRRFMVSKCMRWDRGEFPARCCECGAILAYRSLIARDLNSNQRDLCLEHVEPVIDLEG